MLAVALVQVPPGPVRPERAGVRWLRLLVEQEVFKASHCSVKAALDIGRVKLKFCVSQPRRCFLHDEDARRTPRVAGSNCRYGIGVVIGRLLLLEPQLLQEHVQIRGGLVDVAFGRIRAAAVRIGSGHCRAGDKHTITRTKRGCGNKMGQTRGHTELPHATRDANRIVPTRGGAHVRCSGGIDNIVLIHKAKLVEADSGASQVSRA